MDLMILTIILFSKKPHFCRDSMEKWLSINLLMINADKQKLIPNDSWHENALFIHTNPSNWETL